MSSLNTTTITELKNQAKYGKEYNNVYQIATNLLCLKKQENMLKLEIDKVKQQLLDYMKSNNLDKIEDDVFGGYISLKSELEKIIVDVKKLQNDFPEVYNNSIKISTVKEHLEIKTK